MIAVVLTEGATSPGIQERSEPITDSGYLMPGRLPTLAMSGIWTAAYSCSAGCVGTERRSSSTVICGMVSTSCRRKSSCEPCIRPAIMIVKPPPMATPGLPHAGADVGPCDVEQKFHGDYRLLLMMLRRASLTTESMWAVIAAEITASSGSEGAVVAAATTVASGVAAG